MTHPVNRYEKVLKEKRRAMKGKKNLSMLAELCDGGANANANGVGKMTSKKKEIEMAQAILEEWNCSRPRRVSKKRFVEIDVEGVGMVSVRKEEEEVEEEEEAPRVFALVNSGRQVIDEMHIVIHRTRLSHISDIPLFHTFCSDIFLIA